MQYIAYIMNDMLLKPKLYFPALTGVRACAAYLVFFYHFNPFLGVNDQIPTALASKLPAYLVMQGHIGVSIFFVLSGFLIAARYVGRIQPTLGWAKQYMFNRFARIYPVYFLILTITVVAMLFRHTYHYYYEWSAQQSAIDKTVMLLTSYTLTKGFFQSFNAIFVPTSWSLTVEECFYISAPIILMIVKKKIHKLFPLALFVVAIGAGLTLLSTRSHLYAEFMRPAYFMLYFTYFGRCAEFFIGMGLALWLMSKSYQPARLGTTATGLCLIALCLGAMVFLSWDYKPSKEWPMPVLVVVLNNFVLPLGVATLFYGLICEETFIKRLLSSSTFDLLGKSSYVFYLIHLGFFSDLLIAYFSSNTLVLFVAFNALSILLYKLVEHPIHSHLVA